MEKIDHQDIQLLVNHITMDLNIKKGILSLFSGKEYKSNPIEDDEGIQIIKTNYFTRKNSKNMPVIAEIRTGKGGNSLEGRVYEYIDKKAAGIIKEKLHKYSHRYGLTTGGLLD